MAYKDKNSDVYAECDKISARIKPKYEVDQEIVKEISMGYRIIPTFEKTVYEKVYTNHYSLQRNENLRCRWKKYKENVVERIHAPFQFPGCRDFHFYNYDIKLLPRLSIHNMEHRMRVRPGPGVDHRGHLPIPQEAMMTRGTRRTKVRISHNPPSGQSGKK